MYWSTTTLYMLVTTPLMLMHKYAFEPDVSDPRDDDDESDESTFGWQPNWYAA